MTFDMFYLTAFSACASFFTFFGLNLMFAAPAARTPFQLVGYILLMPLLEEALFRFCVLRAAGRVSKKVKTAVTLQAAVFAVYHIFNPIVIPFAFLSGLCFGWLYLKAGKLDAPYIVHVVVNLTAMLRGLMPVEMNPNAVAAGFAALALGLAMQFIFLKKVKKYDDKLQLKLRKSRNIENSEGD